jgi:hypothetical protein
VAVQTENIYNDEEEAVEGDDDEVEDVTAMQPPVVVKFAIIFIFLGPHDIHFQVTEEADEEAEVEDKPEVRKKRKL